MPQGHASSSFDQKKRKILEQLSVPRNEYNDLSPKGSIDEGIRDLIKEINTQTGLVTTSSCAGRISVFLEGQKKEEITDYISSGSPGDSAIYPLRQQKATFGGKGGGGNWLYISHEPLSVSNQDEESPEHSSLTSLFGLQGSPSPGLGASIANRFVHFKFESMILHVLAASFAKAQLVISAALEAGFRESGAINVSGSKSHGVMPIVGVRSIALALDCIIGYVDTSGAVVSVVTEEYLRTLVAIANDRFKENYRRVEKFRKSLLDLCTKHENSETDGHLFWEMKHTRNIRKREEGLKKSKGSIKENREMADITAFDTLHIIPT